MNTFNIAEWLTAGGTILLAIVAAFQDRVRSLIWCPRLACEVELKPPHCHRTILQPANFYAYYFRFKVWNRGNISAKNVEVIIAEISKKKGSAYRLVEAFSPDNLVWSILHNKHFVGGQFILEPKIYCDYISPDTFKHCNLGHIFDPKYRARQNGENNPNLKVNENESVFCFDVNFRSTILYYIIGPGTYKIQIKVGCENAKTITKKYCLEFTGEWLEDETEMFRKGITIRELQ